MRFGPSPGAPVTDCRRLRELQEKLKEQKQHIEKMQTDM